MNNVRPLHGDCVACRSLLEFEGETQPQDEVVLTLLSMQSSTPYEQIVRDLCPRHGAWLRAVLAKGPTQ